MRHRNTRAAPKAGTPYGISVRWSPGMRSGFACQLLHPLQHVGPSALAIQSRRLGEPTVENLRKFDQRLKIDLGPFRHHAVEYLVAMPPPCAIKTGKEVLSEFLV